MSGLRLDNIGYRFAGAPAATLEGLHLEIPAGEAHALLGGSGAGKTTLLKLISGLLIPATGAIVLHDRIVTGLAPAQRQIAQVFQFPVLYEKLSIADNLGFPLRALRIGSAERRLRSLAIADLLDFAGNGLTDLDGQRPGQLSLYQQQLVAIGKALVRPDLELLLLDEPLTAVEPGRKWALRQALNGVKASTGLTMLYVTHDQTEALTFADRVSVMHNGEILQSGSPAELYARPRHPYVGYFIGSPGMNLIAAEITGAQLRIDTVQWRDTSNRLARLPPGAVTLGFRPEWVELPGATAAWSRAYADRSEVPALSGTIEAQRVTGYAAGTARGLMQVALPQRVQLAGTLAATVGARLQFLLPRFLLFRDDRLLIEMSLTAAPAAGAAN